MSLEMAHKVIVPQKKIMSRSFLNSGTLIVIILSDFHLWNWNPNSKSIRSFKSASFSPRHKTVEACVFLSRFSASKGMSQRPQR
jgi:hypothetical protein